MGADPTAGSPIGFNAYLLGMRGELLSFDALTSFYSPMWAPGGSCRLDSPHSPSCPLRLKSAGRRHRAPAAPAEIMTPIRSMQRETRGEAAGHPRRVGDPLLIWGGVGGVGSSEKQ